MFLQLHPNDNVRVATASLKQGECIADQFELLSPIPQGHKFAHHPIQKGDWVYKFGSAIGKATQAIQQGEWVHTHNLSAEKFDLPPRSDFSSQESQIKKDFSSKSFRGFLRPDGRVGTRNYLAIGSTVNCSAFVVKEAVRKAQEKYKGKLENVDGLFPITHPRGCGIDRGSSSHHLMNRALAGVLHHPNVGARLLVGLGCEKNQAEAFIEEHKLVQIELPNASSRTNSIPLKVTIQDEGGTEKTIQTILEHVDRLLPIIDPFQRSEQSIEHLTLGTQCGGSDGFSGITANPLIGTVSDFIVTSGGKSVFGETSETFGASEIITQRASTDEVAKKYLKILHDYRKYLQSFGTDFHANTAVGNFMGGISTIPEKALGSVMKSGQAPLNAVYDYADSIEEAGLGFMNTPAYDPASCTAMHAGGVNIGLFSTGRGSCYGSKPVPWIKIASNSDLFHRLNRDMDFNAGRLLESEKDLPNLGEELLDYLIEVASGKQTWSEVHGYGDDEFVLWDTGPMT